MQDVFGFPRRSETLGVTGAAGTWRTFWSVPLFNTIAAYTYLCPQAFPGRYFLSGNGMGVPGMVNVTRTSKDTLAPLIRFQYIGQGVGFTNTLTVSPSSTYSGGLTMISLVTSTAGSSAWGYLGKDEQAQLTSIATQVVGTATSVRIQNMAYGGQDLWFSYLNPAGHIGMVVVEYLELPL